MEDHCDRCGTFSEGRRQWMFHQGVAAREFFCVRCLRILRLQAIIGFTLLGLLVAALAGVTLWLRSRPGELQ